MIKKKNLIVIFLSLLLAVLSVNAATSQQLLIEMNEYVDQQVTYNPLNGVGAGIWYDTGENQSFYNLTGYITITNTNANNMPMSDIYLSFDFTSNVTLPQLYAGRTGTFISNDTSSNLLVLHIPEILPGENSTWIYSINKTEIMPPLDLSTSFSDNKALAGDNITQTDIITNQFYNVSYQTNNCIYDINITQITVPVNFSGVPQDWFFLPSTLSGADSGNVTFFDLNRSQNWNVFAGGCLDLGNQTNITYTISSPYNIPKTTDYVMLNTTLKYKLNQTISHLRLIDIAAVSEATLDFEKKIVKPSHPTLYGSNVTWNVTGYFSTDSDIAYDLEYVTFWVSQRNAGSLDLNTIDNDTISNESLNISYTPFTLIDNVTTWTSPSWLFNYSDIPSPIVWMDVNFTVRNDGTQLINRSFTQNGNDIYIKEIYLIIGYWLEINKNITSITNDTYNVKIDVHNKGNQVTPADTVVTIYDFIPSNFNLNGTMVYSSSPWYSTSEANNSVNGEYNGTLYQWGLVPTGAGGLNTSFAQGPAFNENTTWSAEYNVTGFGEYNVMDVFITGLDPQQVDGAGSSKSVVVSEIFDRIKSTEGVFAAVASVLLLLGLLL